MTTITLSPQLTAELEQVANEHAVQPEQTRRRRGSHLPA